MSIKNILLALTLILLSLSNLLCGSDINNAEVEKALNKTLKDLNYQGRSIFIVTALSNIEGRGEIEAQLNRFNNFDSFLKEKKELLLEIDTLKSKRKSLLQSVVTLDDEKKEALVIHSEITEKISAIKSTVSILEGEKEKLNSIISNYRTNLSEIYKEINKLYHSAPNISEDKSIDVNRTSSNVFSKNLNTTSNSTGILINADK